MKLTFLGSFNNYTNQIYFSCQNEFSTDALLIGAVILVSNTFEVVSVDMVVNLFIKLVLDESNIVLFVKLKVISFLE